MQAEIWHLKIKTWISKVIITHIYRFQQATCSLPEIFIDYYRVYSQSRVWAWRWSSSRLFPPAEPLCLCTDRSGSEPVYLQEVRCVFLVQHSVWRSQVKGGSGGLPGAGMTVCTWFWSSFSLSPESIIFTTAAYLSRSSCSKTISSLLAKRLLCTWTLRLFTAGIDNLLIRQHFLSLYADKDKQKTLSSLQHSLND